VFSILTLSELPAIFAVAALVGAVEGGGVRGRLDDLSSSTPVPASIADCSDIDRFKLCSPVSPSCGVVEGPLFTAFPETAPSIETFAIRVARKSALPRLGGRCGDDAAGRLFSFSDGICIGEEERGGAWTGSVLGAVCG
jgi:hypothetical protein